VEIVRFDHSFIWMLVETISLLGWWTNPQRMRLIHKVYQPERWCDRRRLLQYGCNLV